MTTPKSYLTQICLGFQLGSLQHRQAKTLHVGNVSKHNVLLFSFTPECLSKLSLPSKAHRLPPPGHCPSCPVPSLQTRFPAELISGRSHWKGQEPNNMPPSGTLRS